jgi:peroxiredoxin Q/BCP
MPVAGDLAPEVALPDETGTVHRLSDRRDGWTLVYFYPEDDTPGCTTEACQFRDLHPVIAGEGLTVWGLSPDGADSHARFRAKFELPFTLLSDEGHRVAEAYGAWGMKKSYGREYEGITRSSFLVGRGGRIARVWPKVKADGHAADVLATYRALGVESNEASRVGGDERSLDFDPT